MWSFTSPIPILFFSCLSPLLDFKPITSELGSFLFYLKSTSTLSCNLIPAFLLLNKNNIVFFTKSGDPLSVMLNTIPLGFSLASWLKISRTHDTLHGVNIFGQGAHNVSCEMFGMEVGWLVVLQDADRPVKGAQDKVGPQEIAAGFQVFRTLRRSFMNVHLDEACTNRLQVFQAHLLLGHEIIGVAVVSL